MKQSFRFAILSITASGALCMSPQAIATTIYADAFPGSSSNPLNGTTPAVESGTFGGSASATWTAGEGSFTADGGVQASNSIHEASLPFTPQAGNTYTLSADVNTTSGGADWIGLNFFDANSFSKNFWILLSNTRGTNGGQYFTSDDQAFVFNAPTGVVTLSVVLDTTQTNWTESFFANGTLLAGPITPATQPTIASVGIDQYLNGAGTVGNFSLTQAVPEPGSIVLLALGTCGLLGRRQRRNNAAD